MDSITLIFITAIINVVITGIVSGLVFYRYQKRIEQTFAKDLKEFESHLQKSFFEYQTKTALSYAQKVETLASLHRKFWTYAESVTRLTNSLLVLRTGYEIESFPIEVFRTYAESWELIWKKLEDFHSYFESNRFLIPTVTANKIAIIYNEASFDCSFLAFPIKNEDEKARRRWLEEIELSKINFSLEMWTKDLEKIYRSAAENINLEPE